MPTKKERMRLKREQQEKGTTRHQHWINHKILAIVITVVAVVGTVIGSVSFLGKPSSPVPARPNAYLPEVNRINIEDLKAKLDAGSNIVIVDSQPDLNYKISHIVGAISIPLETMATPYTNLDGYDEIITYCN